VSTTSSKGPDYLLNEIKRVLDESKVGFKTDGYTVVCTLDDLQFEVEICKIPRLSVNGLKIKRLCGNSWDYKNMVTALVGKMNL
jgi:MAP/microtubule affinity-regulating kinase